ncbi:MAG TPA: hypothetical protein VMT54_16205 [Candidatus Cybelea sp.]|nr:hypothetical protein [Candidatus Cybelea sp.]
MSTLDQLQDINVLADESTAGGPVIAATSLTELEARLHVHYSGKNPDMPSWRYHASGRALARLRERGVDLHHLFDHDELREAHRQIVILLSPVPTDECSSLDQLFEFPALPPALAVQIRGGTASLSDALLAIKSRPDFKDPARIAGAVEAFAEIIQKRHGMPISGIPARLKQVENHLSALTHADFGVGLGTFESMKSRIRKAVALVDMSAGRRLPKTQLLPRWQEVITKIEEESDRREEQKRSGLMGDRAKLGQLIAFCHERRIDPDSVTDATVSELLAALEADRHSDAFAIARDTVYAWERLQRELSEFPQQRLSRRYRARDGRAGRRALESLPVAFQSAWLDFEVRFGVSDDAPLRSLASFVRKPNPEDDGPLGADHFDEDPFALDEEEDDSWAEDAELPDLADGSEHVARFSPSYLTNIRSAVLHAGMLLQDAERPPNTLLDVVRYKVVERLLRDKHRLQQQADLSTPTRNNSLRNVATCMIAVARALEVSPEQIEALMNLRDTVDPFFIKKVKQPDGVVKRLYADHRMGPRHKERIAAMADDHALLNWFEITTTLFDRLNKIIEKGKTPTPPQANDGVVLVLHSITRCCPLRRLNLAKIPVYGPGAWLRMPLRQGGCARITIPREYVKNGRDLTVELTPEATAMVEFYLKHVRPVIAARVGADPSNPYLFPACGMNHRAPESLNKQFVDRNWKIGGFTLNLHCQRHLAGKIILDRDHKAMETVRQLLGHKSIKTTERYYTEINELFAQKEYHAHLEQHYAELVAKRNKVRGLRSRS